MSGSESDEAHESAAEKRLRLAKEMIERVEAEERDKVDGADVDAEAIGHRLRDDLAERRGLLRRDVAESYGPAPPPEDRVRRLRWRGQPLTCMAADADAAIVYCGCKGGTIVKWDAVSGERLAEIEGGGAEEEGHRGDVLALALSSDKAFLVSGGADHSILVWRRGTYACVKALTGHRGPVTCLGFRRKSLQLFSGSGDRTVKVWDLDTMSYVETLYGHQDTVTAIASLDREHCVSTGARDRSLRLWKIVNETQLLFEAGAVSESLDCVAMLSETGFLTGAQDGTIAMWDSLRKKPTLQIREAHGRGNWITALAALPYGDVAASGSTDGGIRVWRVQERDRKMSLLWAIPGIAGFVNALAFDAAGRSLLAAVAQEHRFGRWSRIRQARNGVRVIALLPQQ